MSSIVVFLLCERSRWLAPETLKTAVYSQKTDVWSFGESTATRPLLRVAVILGVMVWEIMHDGAEPYPGMTVSYSTFINYRNQHFQSAEMNTKVRSGYRMPLTGCGLKPEVIKYIEVRTTLRKARSTAIQTRCWAEEPTQRHGMKEVTVVRANRDAHGV